MDKNNIKNRLTQRFISEETTPGIKVTADMRKKSGAINKKGVGAEAKDAIDYNKSLKQGSDTSKMADNKFNYTNDFEKTYHDEMEIMNGQEMIQYDRKPNKDFQDKAEEGIAGSSRMGNNPEWANVVEKSQGFEGPDFGKNLVKKIKSSEKKRSEQTPTLNLRGRDIQADMKDTGHKPYAFGESVNEMAAAPKKPIGEKTTQVLTAWVAELGEQKAAEKLINKLSQTGMISDLPDSMEYGNGLNKVSGLLQKGDLNNAFHTAKALATRLEKKAMKDMGMFENNVNELTKGYVNKVRDKAMDFKIDSDSPAQNDPILKNRLDLGTKKLGQYINPEIKSYIERIGGSILDGTTSETIILAFPKISMNPSEQGKVYFHITPYNSKIQNGTIKDVSEKLQTLLPKIISKLQADINSQKVTTENNNNPQIKESMKRLKFKKEFNGVGNALKLIPESYKVDTKEFEMTDGNETYRIRWEGNLSEGTAVVITANDKKMVNEDIQRMKALFGYKSQDTLGLVKGNARIDENKVFGDIWKKSKVLLGESEEIEGQTADKTAPFEEAGVKQAAEAKKHVQGSASTEKGTVAPKPKTGNWEDNVKGQAAEAKKHVEGSVSTEKGTKAPKAKEGEWEEIEGSAPEATEHMESGQSTNKATNKAKVVAPAKAVNENFEEEEEEEEDNYNKPDADDDVDTDKEPAATDIAAEVPALADDSEEDSEDAVKVPTPKAGGASLAFSPSLQAYWIKGPGLPLAGLQVPEELAGIAADKSKKGFERANLIIKKLQDMDDTDMGGDEEEIDEYGDEHQISTKDAVAGVKTGDVKEGLFGRDDEKKNAKAKEFDQANAKLVGTKGDQTRNKEKWLAKAKSEDNYNGVFIVDRGVLQYDSKSKNPLQGVTGGSSGMGTANEGKKK